MEQMNTYWLYLEPYTFISEDAKSFFLYNSHNGEGISFTKNIYLNPIIEQLQDLKNLYSIHLTLGDLQEECCYQFVKAIQALDLGHLTEGNQGKPVIMPPLLNLQHGIENLEQHQIPLKEKILPLLQEIVIYVNGICDKNCKRCHTAYKQHLGCTTSDKELDIHVLKEFLQPAIGTGTTITLQGGNIFEYTHLNELLSFLHESNLSYTLVCDWRNLPTSWDKYHTKEVQFKLLINTLEDIPQIINTAKNLHQKGIPQNWEAFVTNMEGFEQIDRLSDVFESIEIPFDITPVYTGNNLSFFEDNVFIDEDTLRSIHRSRQDIFTLQSINPNNFGKIIMLADGQIYTNVNQNPIGNIHEPLSEILCRELSSNNAWRRTRYHVEPCKNCRFKLICPSLSGMEDAIGKNNLCHIK